MFADDLLDFGVLFLFESLNNLVSGVFHFGSEFFHFFFVLSLDIIRHSFEIMTCLCHFSGVVLSDGEEVIFLAYFLFFFDDFQLSVIIF